MRGGLKTSLKWLRLPQDIEKTLMMEPGEPSEVDSSTEER